MSLVKAAYSWDSDFVRVQVPFMGFWRRGNSPKLFGKILSLPVRAAVRRAKRGMECEERPRAVC